MDQTTRCAIADALHDLDRYHHLLEVIQTMLVRTPSNDGLQRELHACVGHAARLATTLFDYVAGDTPPFETIDFGDLVHACIALVQATLSARIAMRVEIGDRLRPIRGVPAELEQLVLALVFEAIEAMPEGGEIRIRVQPTSTAAVCLEVIDTAPRHGAERSVTRRILERHGGAIAVAPRRDRPGSIVTAFLPAAVQ